MASGSETRQRRRLVQVRLTDEEHAALAERAERAGLSAGAFVRAVALGAPGPRAVRRPPVEKAELARLLGQIGRVGSNVNQLARLANAGGWPGAAELDAMAADVAAMRAAVLSALGRG